MEFDRPALERYLSELSGSAARLLELRPLGGVPIKGDDKGYGYGRPLYLEFETGGTRRRAVLSTVKPGPYGHEHASDRAQAQLWAHGAFNTLPGHVRSLDVGARRRDGRLVALGDAEEFFLLAEYADGHGYFEDLLRLREGLPLRELDLRRATALADYLAGIHAVRGTDPGLYVRRVRELVGHGECVMGILDGYPERHGFIDAGLLRSLERRFVDWRWRLKERRDRVCRVHGDFHPWNLLFREGTDFSVLDRSRGEWGEAADDVAALGLNYLFFSLQRAGRAEGPLLELFRRFWGRYLERSGDGGLAEVAGPFLAFRALVMASPVWYPALDERVRAGLFAFIRRVLEADRFDFDSAPALFVP
jgi:hypothetical protein